MFKTIQYLKNHNIEDLNKEYGIIICHHNSLPLTILNYDQISSPINEITKECRSLVINRESKELVSRSFFRFFNWGQYPEEQINFNWNDFSVSSKEDGSLCHIFNWEGQWFATTRGSFGGGLINNFNKTWEQGFCEAMGLNSIQELDKYLVPDLSYSCEFVSPYNKVVRTYAKPAMYFLSAFHKEVELKYWGQCLNNKIFIKPQQFQFNSVDQILEFLKKQEVEDPTFEGFVICDNKLNRWKLKTDAYLFYHRLKDNGNIAHPKNFLSFILNGTDDDLVAKLPELTETITEWKNVIRLSKNNLEQIWSETKDIKSQKDFALAIKDYIYSSILFTARKTGRNPLEIFNESQDLILKKQYPIPEYHNDRKRI